MVSCKIRLVEIIQFTSGLGSIRIEGSQFGKSTFKISDLKKLKSLPELTAFNYYWAKPWFASPSAFIVSESLALQLTQPPAAM
jgi:hypothetical protein